MSTIDRCRATFCKLKRVTNLSFIAAQTFDSKKYPPPALLYFFIFGTSISTTNKTTRKHMDIISNRKLYTVIGASSLGTLIEWYDFYIFGSLATIISEKFFRRVIQRLRFLPHWQRLQQALLCGHSALCFGRLGDLIGRKHTFLLTLIIMGGSTFLIGLVPLIRKLFTCACSYTSIAFASGLALGGEYGGAATYVARACTGKPPRLFYQLDSDNRHAGFIRLLIVIITCQQTFKQRSI